MLFYDAVKSNGLFLTTILFNSPVRTGLLSFQPLSRSRKIVL